MNTITHKGTRGGAIGIGGVTLGPNESAEVDMDAKELQQHPYVREGWLEVTTSAQTNADSEDRVAQKRAYWINEETGEAAVIEKGDTLPEGGQTVSKKAYEAFVAPADESGEPSGESEESQDDEA